MNIRSYSLSKRLIVHSLKLSSIKSLMAFNMHVCHSFLISFPIHIAAVMATVTFADSTYRVSNLNYFYPF